MIRVAAIALAPFLAPIAVTHAPLLRSLLVATVCAVIEVAEPTWTVELPVGLSDVETLKVVPRTEITGPAIEPLTGLAVDAALATADAETKRTTGRASLRLESDLTPPVRPRIAAQSARGS